MPRRKRKTRRRTRRRAPLLRRGSLLLVLAVALVIAGFITRRVLVPRAVHFMQYRPVSRSEASTNRRVPVEETGSGPHLEKRQNTGVEVQSRDGHGERTAPTDTITEHDRRALDRILRSRSK